MSHPSLSYTMALLLASVMGIAGVSAATVPADTIELPVLGKLKTRAAHEIKSSPWSIGGETIDRDFTVYENYKQFLGPLGAKAIRLQAGWAKCERERGVYDWAWLDAIVDDAVSQGVRPWLELGYGNPIYPGGGDTGLGGGLPHSAEALAGWERWSRALVERYKDRVQEWEIWNEPDLNTQGLAPVSAYLELYIRSATVIRALQPEGRIIALSLSGRLEYADRFLAGLKAQGRLDLVDIITIHGYPRLPDDLGNIDRLKSLIAAYGRPIEVRQGETGAPSRNQKQFALRNLSFTENLQAKWNLRRMMAHRAKDVPLNLFTMVDMHYNQYHREAGDALRMNYKGLLATNPDKTVAYAKPAYQAAQHVFTLFDDTLKRLPEYAFTSTALRAVALTGYARESDGAQVVALWFGDAPPAESNGVSLVDIALADGRFAHPVLVDLLTGRVYDFPRHRWMRSGEGTTFSGVPVYDAPVLIAERSVLELKPDNPEAP